MSVLVDNWRLIAVLLAVEWTVTAGVLVSRWRRS